MQERLYEEDIRLVDVLESFKGYFVYLLKKWYLSIVLSGAFVALGFFYAKLTPPTYVAYVSFNAVDSRASAMGGLMSMIGVSFAGGSSNDVLTGIFSSRHIFLKSMLDEMEVDGKKEKIANVYMHAYKYDEGFDEDPEWKGFKFTATDINAIPKKEMDLLSIMYDDFIGGLMVAEFDMATGLIKAEIETPEYQLSRDLGAAMLKHTLIFYQNKQLENASQSFVNTSRRLDSISNQIMIRQRLVAESQDQNPFNRKRQTTVEQQKLNQEIASLNVMYNDAANSRENAKAGLMPASNLIRVIDDPMFSTAPKKLSKLLYTAIGVAVALVLVIIPLLVSKAVQDGREEDRLKAAQQAQAAGSVQA